MTLRIFVLMLVALLVGLAGCDDDSEAAPDAITGPVCPAVPLDGVDITTDEGLRALLFSVQQIVVPELDGVPLDLATMRDETSFFVANLDFATFNAPPLERHYLVRYEPRLFDDPPPVDAVVAILVHELKHILDYTGMDRETFLQFGIDVLSGDSSAYERETDVFALQRGCAEGLKAYRVWIYGQLDEEGLAAKRYTYYTPEEIDAWVAANR